MRHYVMLYTTSVGALHLNRGTRSRRAYIEEKIFISASKLTPTFAGDRPDSCLCGSRHEEAVRSVYPVHTSF